MRSRVRCKKNMVQQIMERKLNLLGHKCRMKDNSLMKEVMFGMMEGQTRRGRSCREWLDDIKEWCREEIHSLNRKVQDHGMWRTVVKTSLDTYGRWAHGAIDGLMPQFSAVQGPPADFKWLTRVSLTLSNLYLKSQVTDKTWINTWQFQHKSNPSSLLF